MTQIPQTSENTSSESLKALAELVEILHREDIEFTDDMDLRNESSRDASIFTKTPQIIIYPRNSSEIGTVVRSISKPLSLSTRAGGTCMTGAPLTDSVLLNLTKHMGYIEVDPKAKIAIVEMGAMYKDIETKTMIDNLYLASYPSSREFCGIGGMIGNNASGEKSLRYGATIDNVISIKAVLRDGFEYEFEELSENDFLKKTKSEGFEGEIYASVYESILKHKKALGDLQEKHPVKKCASGYRIDRVISVHKKQDGTIEHRYNLAPLFVGSQSTLGIITEAKIKLTRKQEHRKMIFMGVKELSELPIILKTILSHDPESVETFDIHTFERAKTFHPEDTNRIENLINEGIAKLTNSPSPKNESIKKFGYTLFVIAEFAGDIQEVVFEQAKDTAKELNALHDLHVFNIDHDDTEAYNSIWNIRRTSFGVMRDFKDGTKHAVPCIEDVIVPTSKFDVFIPKLIKILEDQNIFYGFHGHIGDGSLRIIPVFDLADSEVVAKIDTLCRSVFELIKGLGGNMSADHSDGIIRTPYLKEFYGDEIYNIFVQIKNTFDPEHIFNPGKKIGGTVEDIKKNIIEV
ncbi:MAG: FAD-binding oxidoreductase [Candidatus Pacebacteria bacterium]|nr:FAD-binding oxidoreductase [Candidatus Paceibacterota bacterium]